MKVQQMTSPKSGNPVSNQFIIYDKGATYFQSYRTIIVKKKNGITYLDKNYWDYSRTTSKYRNEFLNESIQDTRFKINTGVYKLTDLNK